MSNPEELVQICPSCKTETILPGFDNKDGLDIYASECDNCGRFISVSIEEDEREEDDLSREVNAMEIPMVSLSELLAQGIANAINAGAQQAVNEGASPKHRLFTGEMILDRVTKPLEEFLKEHEDHDV